MRFLVTGGAGFIGSNVALELERRGMGDVVIVDDFSSGDWKNLADFKGDIVTAHVQDDDWHAKVGPVDAILHQAAETDTTVLEAEKQMLPNVEGLRSILTFASAFGVDRIVYASSAGVYGNAPCPMRESQAPTPHNSYGFSKAIADNLAARYAAEHPDATLVGLRYFNVYGPREAHKGSARSMILQLAQQMKAGRRPRIFTDGSQARDFVYVKDVVEANLLGLKSKGFNICNVGTGKAISFNRIIEVLNETLGTSFTPEYFDNPYAGYQDLTQADTRNAAEKIGFKAQWSIEDGIRDYIGGTPAHQVLERAKA
jgi:ADP-L-glycero-D-manno-heptose 6-epimerase